MSEKTPDEHVSPCSHCWHDTGMLRLSNPPQMEEVCCWCGDKRLRHIGYVSGLTVTHGPHATSGVLTMPRHPFAPEYICTRYGNAASRGNTGLGLPGRLERA